MQERNAHLATWPGVYPSSQQSYALRRQEGRSSGSSGEFSPRCFTHAEPGRRNQAGVFGGGDAIFQKLVRLR